MFTINVVVWPFAALGVCVVLGVAILSLLPMLLLWNKARQADLGLAFVDIVSMRVLHKVDANVIVNAMVTLKESGAMERDPTINYRSLVEHAIAGGNIDVLATKINDDIRYGRQPKSFQELAKQQLES